MGEIWRARHGALGSQWLVKLLPEEFARNPDYAAALLREAKLTASLPGHYFPSVVHAGVSGGIAFYGSTGTTHTSQERHDSFPTPDIAHCTTL